MVMTKFFGTPLTALVKTIENLKLDETLENILLNLLG